ncbi:MAG TPA: hypothetical protein PLL57_10745 [Flavobacteriales bacterium]|nr:hypothetical protein [Flavobacteriales bacterium]
MYDIVLDTGALLLLAVAALVYVLLSERRRLVLRGRFVGLCCDAQGLYMSNREGTLCIKEDGVFCVHMRPGDSITWSIRSQETHYATMRVDVDSTIAQNATFPRWMDLGEVNLDRLHTGGEHCRILHLEGATVILRTVGTRLPSGEHQMLDRAPYWLREHPLSHKFRTISRTMGRNRILFSALNTIPQCSPQ